MFINNLFWENQLRLCFIRKERPPLREIRFRVNLNNYYN